MTPPPGTPQMVSVTTTLTMTSPPGTAKAVSVTTTPVNCQYNTTR